ncbi:MAG TPA: SGNH/GDSL hydrolase family protein, partial [Aquihabitans sp.]|nr:SGNH/GDSL hydrolase family protein [Aquihabitans sp.]
MTLRLSCLGDSLTRAQLSADYVDQLGRDLPPGALEVSRFGVNGDLAYNLLQRLDQVLDTPADVVTVLIGTNDARASVAGHPVEATMRRKHLPVRPTPTWFRDCLGEVVERLGAETDARVGLLSPPVLGQDLAGPAAAASGAVSRIVAELASDLGVALLPLHDAQVAHLRRAGAPAIPYREATTGRVVGTL